MRAGFGQPHRDDGIVITGWKEADSESIERAGEKEGRSLCQRKQPMLALSGMLSSAWREVRAK
ncbi:MAG: hypothetical protein D6723_13075 [Acidobacteria bacterium]|nr:MAG: hypothetical protein D6723_13075 [Acidobacteriota bacterium]